jgi:NAD(P)-dependent dehydrogenase (short-subunit alcohol dehydrogenase family)
MPDLTGKHALVTGANTGLGYQEALALATLGAHVIVAGRNPAKLEEAVASLQTAAPAGQFAPGIVDLNSLSSVRGFADRLLTAGIPLDILINNAGVMAPPAGRTEDGFESQFGVNFVAHFLLTGLLFPLLRTAPAARIVTLSSIGHRGAAIDFDNLRLEKPYDPWREYGQSKLADLILALELDKRLRTAGLPILSLAAHPGISKTELTRNLGPVPDDVAFMPPADGAAAAVLAATGPDVEGGQYYGPTGPGETSGAPGLAAIDPAARDETLRARLWDWAEAATGVRYP